MGEKLDYDEAFAEARLLGSRRFDADKMQSVQLLTKKIGSQKHFTLVMQFNDIIASSPLNETKEIKWEQWCEKDIMVRRHLVRGHNEQLYFVENRGNSDII